VKPDIVCLDGHQFHINYGVPPDVTETSLMWPQMRLYSDIRRMVSAPFFGRQLIGSAEMKEKTFSPAPMV
jgi:hypothetical protein